MNTTEHPTPPGLERLRVRDERDQLRAQLDSFARLLTAAERGGAAVMRIDDIRRALKIGARQ